jgi:hypothetical protein
MEQITISNKEHQLFFIYLEGEYKLALMHKALEEMIKATPFDIKEDEITISIKSVKQ